MPGHKSCETLSTVRQDRERRREINTELETSEGIGPIVKTPRSGLKQTSNIRPNLSACHHPPLLCRHHLHYRGHDSCRCDALHQRM